MGLRLCLLVFCGFAAAQAVTLEEVQQHSTPDDCWSALYGQVYGLTAYGPRHKGGASLVWRLCGIDGTSLYDSVHGNHQNYLQDSSIQQFGTLASPTAPPPTAPPPAGQGTPAPTPASPASAPSTAATTLINFEQLALHNTPEDCWVAYYDHVYDVTEFAYLHPSPPGEVAIHMSCGNVGTKDYAYAHPKDLLSLVEYNIVGSFNTTSGASVKSIAAAAALSYLCVMIVGLYT